MNIQKIAGIYFASIRSRNAGRENSEHVLSEKGGFFASGKTMAEAIEKCLKRTGLLDNEDIISPYQDGIGGVCAKI